MEYRIKEILRERGIRIEDFAESIGVKRETLSRIINGASTSSETLQTIADNLNVHIVELFVPKKDGTSGYIEHNGVVYKINSVSDLENILEEIKKIKINLYVCVYI